MYESFFGFHEQPFGLTPNPRCLVLTDGHREAISSVEYGIATRKGIVLLTGDAGCGKTTVLRTAIERQPVPVHSVHLSNPALTRSELIEMLAACFHLSARARESKAALLLELEELLQRRHLAGETTVLIVDEAQTVSPRMLEEFRLLANIESNEHKLLSVVLAGLPELTARLDEPAMAQLKQRVAISCELKALTFKETAAYMLGRIKIAGGAAADTFTIEAVQAIHEASKGIPRSINVIADNALVTAVALERRPVDSQIVHLVCRELRIGQKSGTVSRHTEVVTAATISGTAWPSSDRPHPVTEARRESIPSRPAAAVAATRY